MFKSLGITVHEACSSVPLKGKPTPQWNSLDKEEQDEHEEDDAKTNNDKEGNRLNIWTNSNKDGDDNNGDDDRNDKNAEGYSIPTTTEQV